MAAGGPGLRLALSSDSAIRRFGSAHLSELKRIAAWVQRHLSAVGLHASSNSGAGAVLRQLDFTDASVKPGHGRDVFIAIDGITDNAAGFANVPSGERAPTMDPREFIYVERIAPGWYVYKTT